MEKYTKRVNINPVSNQTAGELIMECQHTISNRSYPTHTTGTKWRTVPSSEWFLLSYQHHPPSYFVLLSSRTQLSRCPIAELFLFLKAFISKQVPASHMPTLKSPRISPNLITRPPPPLGVGTSCCNKLIKLNLVWVQVCSWRSFSVELP